MPKQKTLDDKPVCFYCGIEIREIMFAYWMKGKPHCSLGCAIKTRNKMERVNRWKLQSKSG